MRTVRLLSMVAALLVTLALPAADHAPAAESLEKDPFFQLLSRHWKDVPLSRDIAHWRAPEVTPGAFLCRKPAATDAWVSCDRWPDASDSRRFGLDVIRLSGAKTDHEKALAVYRWVRRWMTFTSKDVGAPAERLARRLEKNPCIHDPAKLLNVYGSHWCGGQARVVEMVWRALGYRAEKVARGGHTVVGLQYRDFDKVERWHLLDVSHSAVAWHRSYRRLLSADELSSQWYSFYYQYGLPGNGHTYFAAHRMELALRPGEKFERIWGNWKKPYQNNAVPKGDRMEKKVPSSERGPYYPFKFGNGRWTYKPDLSTPEWAKGLAEPMTGMRPGKLQPKAAGKPASAVWHFRTPYIVSDAAVTIKVRRKSAEDSIRLHLSLDGGKTWAPLWECPPDVVGAKQLSVPICEKFPVTEKGRAPKDLNSPFGRYAYRLKLELVAKGKPEDCRVEEISFGTSVQQNILALPQLQPGKNKITVRGNLAKGSALKVTYVWDDPAGKGRRNVTVVEKAPYTYEIIAAGSKWADCVCRSLLVEAVPATGEGNRTVEKEKLGQFTGLPTGLPVEETMDRWNGQPLKRELPALQEVLAAAKDGRKFRKVMRAAVIHADPRTFEAFKKVAYNVVNPNDKLLAFNGMYLANPEKARPILLDILNDREGKRVKWDPRKDKKNEGWGRLGSWCIGGTVIGYIAAEAGWKEFLPGLIKVLECKECSHKWGPRYGTVRVIGRLGKGDKAAAEVIKKVLTHKMRKENGDTLIPAARAAGQIGDPALIPALRKHVAGDYWPLKHNAALSLGQLGDKSIIPRMREWLTVRFDENFRGYAAEALGHLKDKSSVKALTTALAVEPFPWVREKIHQALKRINPDYRGVRLGETPGEGQTRRDQTEEEDCSVCGLKASHRWNPGFTRRRG